MATIEQQTSSGKSHLKEMLPALVVLTISLIGAGLSLLKLPASGEPVALVFNPSIAPDTMFHRVASLDGRILRSGGTANVLIASFTPGTSLEALRRQGVLLTLDPVVAGGCTTRNLNEV